MLGGIKEFLSNPVEINKTTIILLIVGFVAAVVGIIFFIKLMKREFRYGASINFTPFNVLVELLFLIPFGLFFANAAFSFRLSPIILIAAFVLLGGGGIVINFVKAGIGHGILYSILDIILAVILAELIVEAIAFAVMLIFIIGVSIVMWTSGRDVTVKDELGNDVRLFYNENTGVYSDSLGNKYAKGTDNKLHRI